MEANDQRMFSRRWRRVALVAIGVALGTTLTATPVYSHVGGTVAHLWVDHIRPLADNRYPTKAAAEARYVNVGEKASNADKLDGADSAAFLRTSGKAADAELFDGMDSNIFVTGNSFAGGDLSGRYPSPTVRSNAIGSDEVELNSLNGADIDESTLAEVPSAANAGSVDGQSAATFNFKSIGPDSWKTLFTLGGLQLYVRCVGVSPGTDQIEFAARTTADNSFIWSDIAGVPLNGDWDVADANPDDSADRWFADTSDRAGVIVYRQGDASLNAAPVVTVTLAWRTTSSSCETVGSAVGH